MSSNVYYDNIQKYLFQYADLVNHSNSLGLTDKALHAENLFAEILHQVFGWKLTNANEFHKNQDTFDLTDDRKRICVQVTTDKNFKRKYTRSLQSFQTGSYEKYKHFIILFIAKKVKAKLPAPYTDQGITYEHYDLSQLLDKIFYRLKTPAKLEKLNQVLQQTLAPVLLEFNKANTPALPAPKQHLPVLRKGLYIDRSALVQKLFEFSQAGNGLIVGGPGYGKSFTLEELHRYYQAQKLECVLIRINELTEGTDAEIALELKTDGNWLEALQLIKAKPNGPNLLIFDAYDTAKDEKLKANILKQIRRAIQELAPDWRVLVSVRTYDATKSRNLQELFPHANITQVVQCRYLEIGELTDEELRAALGSNALLQHIAGQCSQPLRKLLKTPYFLKLFEQIILDNNLHSGQLFSGIETEGQLLEIYWKHKVEDAVEKAHFTQQLALLLAEKEALVCLKTDMLAPANLPSYEQLLSLGIIAESTISGKKIGFTHNILLDFAIAKYLLEDDLDAQVALISAHEKMPFIFRQSFMYFYTRLYKTANPIFWQHYFGLARIDQPLFRLLHQTSLNHVLVQFYNDYRELLPIFDEPDADKRGHSVRRLLESVRFITKGNIRLKDLALLKYTTANLHWIMLWETGYLLEKAIELFCKEPGSPHTQLISDGCCNYLDFILTERQTFPSKYLIDQNGGSRGIDNFCKTFTCNIPRGKKLIRRLLDILKEEDFPINLFLYLSNYTTELYAADPATGSLVYQTLYQHNESSDKVTSLGNSVVMNLRSNRKQDYGLVYYRLEKTYPEMLAANFLPAMQFGIAIVNHHSNFKLQGYRPRPHFQVRIGTIKARLSSDYSFYEGDTERGAFSHAESIFRYLEKEFNKGITKKHAEPQLLEMIKVMEAAMLWRRLIKLLCLHARVFKTLAFELLTNTGFYSCDETLYDAGELLRLLWPYLSTNQKITLEKTVHALKNEKELLERGIAERRISRILNCVPPGELQLPESLGFIRDHEPVSNDPTVSSGPVISISRGSSREENIIRSGFDTDNATDMQSYAQIEQLEQFNNRYQSNENEKLAPSDYQHLLPVVEYLFGESKSWPVHQRSSAEYELSRFARILSSLGKKLPSKERNWVSQSALEFVQAPQYHDAEYQKGAMRTHGNAFGPNAKTTSVQTLINMLSVSHARENANALRKLLGDNTTIIRYKASRALTHWWHKERAQFWVIIHDRIAKETDGMAFAEVIRAISYDNIIKENQPEVKACAAEIMERLREADDDIAADLWRMFTVLLLKLILRYDKAFARQLITANLAVKELSRSLIFELMTVIDPHSPENDYSQEPDQYDDLIDLVLGMLEYRFTALQGKSLASTESHNDLEIIDYVTQHLCFITETGRNDNKGQVLSRANKTAFYQKIRPVLDLTVERSLHIGSGFMVAHTGYYFMQTLNFLVDIDPEHILSLSNSIVLCAATNGFTYDQSTLKEVIELTEHIIADHKEILYKNENFNQLIIMLDQFASSGWQEALEMTWRLKDAF